MEKYKNKIFKILPLFEGKVENEELYLDKDTAYKQYQEYVSILIIEFTGIENEPFIEILHYLKGLKALGQEVTHTQVRRVVFHCISLLKE